MVKGLYRMGLDLLSIALSEKQFSKISQLVHKICGINLQHGKEELVKARLLKRIKLLNLNGFEDYLKYIENDHTGQELNQMIDLLTTNKTSFFREPNHFDYLRLQVFPRLMNAKKIRIWSVGCSSGEEPFSIAILLREYLPDIDQMDVRILATDISTRVLTKAREAIYSSESLQSIPKSLLNKYFTRDQNISSSNYKVKDHIRKMIRLARLNLMENWPMSGPFDIIFCRNVMIYFDKPTQQALNNRFWNILKSDGYLFIGHSESMMGLKHRFQYLHPAIYQK